MTRQECMNQLEAMLDAGITPDMIVECLGDVCGEKEEHVVSNWQDRELGKVWHKHASACQAASAKLTELWANYPAW